MKSKGKAMALTLSDGEVSDDESKCDKDGNFIAFTAIAIVNESIFAKENPSNGNSLRMQIFNRPTINFAKLLQKML